MQHGMDIIIQLHWLRGRGYSKGHTLGLWADMSLRQDLSSITKGLGASFHYGI